MWLLSTDRAELHYFANNFEATGGYAILSHTWDKDGEQTLQEIRAIIELCRQCRTNPRDFIHPKIRKCCKIAEKHGYRWVWIDSCCIDKTSSSELSEAINSMFRWYKEAEVCFAYLADVPGDCVLRARDSAFRKSRWHTRGWTLQELIAPDFLIFLSAEWRELGNRADLAGLLRDITGVPRQVLTGEAQPAHYSVSIRMFWASKRKTTRVEDEAYCLMGLFKVRMPTNYGEGEQAFIRLQYEIMQHDPDMSLLMFGYRVSQDHNLTFYPEEVPDHNWKYLMANSLREFNSRFVYIPDIGANAKKQYPPPLDSETTGPFEGGVELPRLAVTSYGIELRVPIHEAEGITIAVILCQRNGHHFGLFLTRDKRGKDPKRPRYFTSCHFTKPDTGSARYAARLADLGDDLCNLTFNGKPVKASWRTIYIVPTAPDFDSGSSTTPNLIMNCNPASHFRVPRWLVARFTALQFQVTQAGHTETLQVIKFSNTWDYNIYVCVGSCTHHRDDDPDLVKPVQLWARAYILYSTNPEMPYHDCPKDHLDSESWSMRARFFGDAERKVRLTLTPSTLAWKPDSNSLVVHLELFGRVYEKMLQDAGNLSLFPSPTDLARETAHIAPNNPGPATPSRPRAPLQIEAASSPQTPPPPSSRTDSSTSTISSHRQPSRIPRPVSRSPPHARTVLDRPRGGRDDSPKPAQQSRQSQRQSGDARRLQTFSPTPPAGSRSQSGTPRERAGMNKEGRADSRGVGGAIKDSDRWGNLEGKHASGTTKRS